jgi:hypothetical protein
MELKRIVSNLRGKIMKRAFKTALAVFALLAGCSSKSTQPTASETPAGGSTAPSGQDAANQKKALVRFAQTIPGSQRMDLWFGDMKTFSNVAYKEVTPYIEVPAERHEFKLQTAGNTQVDAMATNREGLSAGGHYTIVAEQKSGKSTYTLDALNDDLIPPDDGKAKLRVVNASLGLGKIDVVNPDGKLFGGVAEDSGTSYKEVAPSQGTIEIRHSDKKADALRVTNLSLQPGRLYTLFIVGGAAHPLEAVPVTDQLVGPAGGD